MGYRKSALQSLIGFFALFFWLASAQGADEEGVEKQLISGMEQAMLTQRIAKSSCYIAAFRERTSHLDILSSSLSDFTRNQNSIAHPPALSAWNIVLFAGQMTLDMPGTPGLDIDLMYHAHNELYHSWYKAFKRALQTNPMPYLTTLGAIGDLSVRLQKNVADFCYASIGFDPAQNREALQKGIATFDKTLSDLKKGNLSENILAPPTAPLASQLVNIEFKWQVMRTFFKQVAEGKPILAQHYQIIANFNEVLLKDIKKLIQDFRKGYNDAQPSRQS